MRMYILGQTAINQFIVSLIIPELKSNVSPLREIIF